MAHLDRAKCSRVFPKLEVKRARPGHDRTGVIDPN